MKVLFAHPDPAGFNFTFEDELLRLGKSVCPRIDCGCDCSWSGNLFSRGATLARVVKFTKTPPEIYNNPHLARAMAIAKEHPEGTLLRCQFDWKVNPGRVDVEVFLDHWKITVVEPTA